MSYKALLFCPDETAARLVTQVLSELDFTVELSFEPFITVKKLTEEPFDAVVVDCANEQNASLLFKGARNSSLNHSALCVAVAEGQAGVANAFRIGANLVLTKPVNIEQSKNTLRVAKGLLRKSAPAPQTHAEKPIAAPTSAVTAVKPMVAPEPGSLPGAESTPASARAVPSSLFEAEQVKTPLHADSTHSTPKQTPAPSMGSPGPLIPSAMARAAAAPALAPERLNRAAEAIPLPKLKTAAPLATQDPIFPETKIIRRTEVPVPTFASYASHHSAEKSGGGKALWIIICLVVLGAGGYVAWKKLPVKSYIARIHIPAIKKPAPPSTTADKINSDATSSGDLTATQSDQQTGASTQPSSAGNATSSWAGSSAANSTAAVGFPTKEHIDISVPAESSNESAGTTAEPVIVAKPAVGESGKKHANLPAAAEPPAPVPPPDLALSGSNGADSALAGIVAANPTLPRAALGTLRISQGITQGLLMKSVSPAYPALAREMRKEGTVDLLATISKTGAITKVKVLSGDATLAKSAVDAVRQWKYRPYLLNGEPVEIETQITINFKLPH